MKRWGFLIASVILVTALYGLAQYSITPSSGVFLLLTGGTLSGDLDAGGNSVTNVAYVDGVDVGTDVPANTTHRTSTGADHSYIDQDLRSSVAVTFKGVTSTGDISGYTPVAVDTSASVVLVTADCTGRIRLNGDDDAIDYTLPTVSLGSVITIANSSYDQVITVDCQGTDTIILNDRTSLTAGNAVDSSGAKDDLATFVGISSTEWLMLSIKNTWVDGGTD